MVEFGFTGQHVGVGVRGHGQIALVDLLTIRAHGIPRRCRRLILRCLRSCGLNNGNVVALQVLAIEVRRASEPESPNSRA